MLPINVKALLDAREIESSRIEYKRNWNPAKCIRTICAFANDIEDQDGGYILIGVEEKKTEGQYFLFRVLIQKK